MVQQSEEEFVNIWFGNEPQNSDAQAAKHKPQNFTEDWLDQSGAKHAYPATYAGNALRRLYPNHSVVSTTDYRLDPTIFPGAYVLPLEKTPLFTKTFFAPLTKRQGYGALVDSIDYGAFKVAWDKYEFIVYRVMYPLGFGVYNHTFVLHEGPEDPSRALLLATGIWREELHQEIWTFNQGFWQKDHKLWEDVQSGNWKDVILDEDFKTNLQKDIYGFFDSEAIYKRLAIPWKRGLILHGPPGNGKTISIKVILKTCSDKGFNPLYVKSFQSYKGEEGAMQDVFDKARQLTPCVLIIEDLDSLINDRNRSFFLNQLDGLAGNDGLLLIGTTNHLDRLDPGLSERPSRFDRKYLFDDPNRDERIMYAQYWQDKLKYNDEIAYPDSLVFDIADVTDKFSFAYLKEAFVSSLVLIAGEKQKSAFQDVIMQQIKLLRKAIDKGVQSSASSSSLRVSQPQQLGIRVAERRTQGPFNHTEEIPKIGLHSTQQVGNLRIANDHSTFAVPNIDLHSTHTIGDRRFGTFGAQSSLNRPMAADTHYIDPRAFDGGDTSSRPLPTVPTNRTEQVAMDVSAQHLRRSLEASESYPTRDGKTSFSWYRG